MKYHYAILGGTFDRFHAGHKALINAACESSEKVDIGITTEKFYKNKTLSNIIETYQEREKSVKEYLIEKGFSHKTTIVKLEDIYGNGLKKRDIDAIFVTKDTEQNAKLINEKRVQQGFPEMEIIVIPFILTEDEKPITAERIRRGEINREGKVYINLFRTDLKLPESLREKLRKPIGETVTSLRSPRSFFTRDDVIITVGDIVTLSLINTGLTPALSIIDFKTQRQQLDEKELKQKLNLPAQKQKNDPGTISKITANSIQQKIQQFIETNGSQVIVIDGEEDLLTLPAIMFAPLQSKVIYGQIGRGAILVNVTEEIKEKVSELIKNFDKP